MKCLSCKILTQLVKANYYWFCKTDSKYQTTSDLLKTTSSTPKYPQ